MRRAPRSSLGPRQVAQGRTRPAHTRITRGSVFGQITDEYACLLACASQDRCLNLPVILWALPLWALIAE